MRFLPFFGLMALVPIVGILFGFGLMMGRASRLGFASMGEYLAAAPRSDRERRDAADLAMKGLVICMLGFIFPTLVLAGLVPLFYGGRKLAYASMGLGLVDDSSQHHV